MTCNCNENKDSIDCPEGQSFDVSQGKCVAKEAIGDAQAQSVGADTADSGADTGDKQEVKATECPEGHVFDADQDMCVPKASDKTDDIGQTQADITTERLDSIEKSIKALAENKYKPTAKVTVAANGTKTYGDIVKEMAPALRNNGRYQFNIGLDSLRASNIVKVQEGGQIVEAFRSSPAKITEAVSISGTHATQDLDAEVAIVPGGISFKPVFQFAKVKHIEAGSDRARFFKTTIPANGTQTVGSTPSEATQTLTSVEVVPSTITGVYLVGDFDEIENSPFDLVQAIVDASAASYEDFVATDMLDTVSAEGTLTPGLWIRGDSGATVTTSDTASVALDETGIAYAREYLENQGYLRGGIKPVLFLDPQQWRELITSTNVTSLATRSAPDVWIKGELENFMGVQLVVTNAVEHKSDQTNASINAIMCIPKHSYGIAVKRDVTVKMHEYGEDNQVRINTSWRTKAGVIDSSSIVRISTTD